MKPFRFGQKVWCWWYNSWFFRPPKCATILCKLPYKGSYYCQSEKEQFWLVKVHNGLFAAIPDEGCIKDLKQKIKEDAESLGSRPMDKEQARSWDTLIEWNNNAIEFLNNK